MYYVLKERKKKKTGHAEYEKKPAVVLKWF